MMKMMIMLEQYKEAKKQKREIAQASGARQYSVRVLPIEKEKEQELNKKDQKLEPLKN